MALSSDTTNFYYVTDNGDGAIMTRQDELWAFDGTAPSAVRDSSAVAVAVVSQLVDASGGATNSWGFDSSAHALSAYTAINACVTGYNAIRAALIEKGILH